MCYVQFYYSLLSVFEIQPASLLFLAANSCFGANSSKCVPKSFPVALLQSQKIKQFLKIRPGSNTIFSMRIHRALTRFVTWMAAISDKQVQDDLLQIQKSLDYCQEENRVLREILLNKYGCKRLGLTDSQRRRLAQKGYVIGRHWLGQVSVLFGPETVLSWCTGSA